MKVEGNSLPVPIRDHDSKPSTQSSAVPRQLKEEVKVSGQAQLLAAARSPEQLDEARIERLRTSIENGDFVVDADKIAERIVLEEG